MSGRSYKLRHFDIHLTNAKIDHSGFEPARFPMEVARDMAVENHEKPRRGRSFTHRGRDLRGRQRPSPPPLSQLDRYHFRPSKRSRRNFVSDNRRGHNQRFKCDIGVGNNGIPTFDRGGLKDKVGNDREGLMTYKLFIAKLEDDISPDEAARRYEEYRTEYISTQKGDFFKAHKDEEWLKDLYDPSHFEAGIQRRNEKSKTTAREFLSDLQFRTVDIGSSATRCLSLSGYGEQGGLQALVDGAEVSGEDSKHSRGLPFFSEEKDIISASSKAHLLSSEPRRVQKDIEQGQAIIRKLDAEKCIGENILGYLSHDMSNADKSLSGLMKGLKGIDLLNVIVDYLWQVHGVDYYRMIELKDPPKSFLHTRVESRIEEESAGSFEWEKILDLTRQSRLAQDPTEIMSARQKLEAATTEALDSFMIKIEDEKYVCGVKGCTKVFCGAEYLQKHLRLMHVDIVERLTTKECEKMYFQNYMNDPDAPGVTVIAQQPGQQQDKLLMRNTVLGGPTLDREFDCPEGANCREDDRIDRAHEDADSSKLDLNSSGRMPFHLISKNKGRLRRWKGRQNKGHLRGRRGSSGGWFSRGRGILEPQLSFPMSSPFCPDTRPIRKYHDLDAMQDEVTVIDFRSF
eukprot:Gb_37970 [translate_table: standard]